MDFIKFPKGFIFGTSTAAYQIEGAWNEANKGQSIWDNFAHTPGKIIKGQTGDIACDHYHRYKEDIALMQGLGTKAYRMSISWPRILPQGKGGINDKGIAFYDRLTDSLLEAGITPWVTLFHWDLPQALQTEMNGFENRDIVNWFADYVQIVVKALGDRVKNWITLNEMQDYALEGYFLAQHAPGKFKPWKYLSVVHNQLLCHGRAVQVIKGLYPDSKVGPALNLLPVDPATGSEKDRESAMLANELFNRITLHPIIKSAYPSALFRQLRMFMPDIRPDDMGLISTPVDFIGINTYTREKAMHKWYIPFLKTWMTGADLADKEFVKDGVQHTAMGWEVYPESIYRAITLVKEEYNNPEIIITENGAAFEDRVEGDHVHDPKRISFLKAYLAQVKKTIDEGAQVKGYFVWTLIDNFEWAVGYEKRFGLVHVDHDTQKRIIKDSGYWYRDLIAAQTS
ncbi:MAG: GH1 family beta-glucosidase [Thermodesulfobacteriota bacterium]|nr:GH1 family beta-glucosidase [Thermodesulfobacteriota bacterium]